MLTVCLGRKSQATNGSPRGLRFQWAATTHWSSSVWEVLHTGAPVRGPPVCGPPVAGASKVPRTGAPVRGTPSSAWLDRALELPVRGSAPVCSMYLALDVQCPANQRTGAPVCGTPSSAWLDCALELQCAARLQCAVWTLHRKSIALAPKLLAARALYSSHCAAYSRQKKVAA